VLVPNEPLELPEGTELMLDVHGTTRDA